MAKNKKKGGEKKIEKKVEKKVERKVAKKLSASRRKTDVTAPGQKLSYKQLNSQSAKSKQIGGPAEPTEDTKEYVTTLLNPYWAYDAGYTPTYPDGSMVSAYRFSTKTLVSVAGVANGGTTDVWFRAIPMGKSHLAYATAFAAGLPSAFTVVDVTGYSSWSTLFDNIRCVAIGIVCRNTTSVQTQAGDVLQARLPIELSVTTSWSNISVSSDSAVRGLSNPGDMGLTYWLPQTAAVTGDTQFKEYNADNGTNPTGTSIINWSQAGAAHNLLFEVYAFWEAHVYPSSTALLPMVTKCGDPALANRLLMKCLNSRPGFSQERMVAKDDGDLTAAIGDIKSIWGGVKSAMSIGKRVYGWATSLFSDAVDKQKKQHLWVGRVLAHFRDDPDVFDLLMQYVRFNPHCTLADVLAYFETYNPEPPSPTPTVESKYMEIVSPNKMRAQSSTR